LAQNAMEILAGDAARTARDIWLKGWAEAGAGNISVRVDPAAVDLKRAARGRWVDIQETPGLKGRVLFMTAGGSLFRTLREDPFTGCGLLEIDAEGRRCRTLVGFHHGGKPSSEMPSHLTAHEALVQCGREECKAIVHCHASSLLVLQSVTGLETRALTRLLWGIHSEGVALFPDGVEVCPWSSPGSVSLSRVTAEGFRKRRILLWPYHGVIAAGEDIREAFGLIEAAEKAAELVVRNLSLGGPKAWLSSDDLDEIASRFGVSPDREILRSPVHDFSTAWRGAS